MKINQRVLDRVGMVLQGFPYLIFLPLHLQNDETRHADGSKIEFQHLKSLVNPESCQLIQDIFKGAEPDDCDWFFLRSMQEDLWFCALLNYLYVLSHYPEENPEHFFEVLEISLKKDKLFQVAAALSFLADKSMPCQDSLLGSDIDNLPYLLKPVNFKKYHYHNPILQLNNVHRILCHQKTEKCVQTDKELTLFHAACAVASGDYAGNNTFKMVYFFMSSCPLTGDKGMEYHGVDLLGFPLSALFDTVPNQSIMKDIINHHFDDLCADAASLGDPFADIPREEIYRANYFPSNPHECLPMMEIFCNKDWNKALNGKAVVALNDFLTFNETVQNHPTPYNLFSAVYLHIQGDPKPLKDLAAFPYPEYIAQLCAYEALLLITHYADVLGLSLCRRLIKHFFPKKSLLKVHQADAGLFSEYIRLCSNQWANRLKNPDVLRNSIKHPRLTCSPKSSLSIKRKSPLQWLLALDLQKNRGTTDTCHFYYHPYQPILSKTVKQTKRLLDFKPKPPLYFSLKDTDAPILRQVLERIPFFSHDFGKYAFPYLKSVYRMKQGKGYEHLFNRKTLKEFHLINRMADTGKYLHDFRVKTNWDFMFMRMVLDALNHPKLQIDVNQYPCLEIEAAYYADDVIRGISETVDRIKRLYPLIHSRQESVLPFVQYILNDEVKQHDLRYIFNLSVNHQLHTLINTPRNLSKELIPYLSDTKGGLGNPYARESWEEFFIFFALPLWHQYIEETQL